MKIPPKSDIQVTDFNPPFVKQIISQVENVVFEKIGKNYGLSVHCKGAYGSASMKVTVELAIPPTVIAEIHPTMSMPVQLYALMSPKGTKVQFRYKGKWLDGVIDRRAGKRYVVIETVPAGKTSRIFKCPPSVKGIRLAQKGA